MTSTTIFRKQIPQTLLDRVAIVDGLLVWTDPYRKRDMGAPVGGKVLVTGYKAVCTKDGYFYVHRIVFHISHGYCPTYIDHIDGDKTNNSIENLREAMQYQNLQNSGKRSNNTSGYKGVFFQKQNKRWCSAIGYQNKKIHLGSFDTPELAHQAYCDAAKSLHGNFARFA